MTREPRARHVEIWGHLVENNVFLRRLAIALACWSFVALCAGCIGLYLGLYRPVAYYVDTEGQATLVGRLREHSAPHDAEVRFVAKEFVKRYLAFNSLTIESDLAEAWNLMTDELRKQQEEVLARYLKEKGQDFVGYVKAQGIQTVPEFDSRRIDVVEHNGKTYTVRLVGTMRTWPLNRVGEDAAYLEKSFESMVTLVRCPRTESTPNGLLVAKVTARTFVPEESPTAPAAAPGPAQE